MAALVFFQHLRNRYRERRPKSTTQPAVEVSTGVKVEKVDDQGVIAAGVRIPSATVLWTAGVSASPVGKMLGTQTPRRGAW